jgi:hypothetical protein
MKPRHAAALAYIIGWALVLSALMLANQHGYGYFAFSDYAGENLRNFAYAVLIAWASYTVPCLVAFAFALWSESRTAKKNTWCNCGTDRAFIKHLFHRSVP